MNRPSNKTLVIVGADGGIGSAVALLGAKKGYAIAVGYHSNITKAQNLVSKIKDLGSFAQSFQVDVSDPSSVATFFNAVTTTMGSPVGVVNCAGITGGINKVSELSIEAIQKIINVNLLGTIYCTREASARMSLSKGGAGGVIVNISSEAAKFGGVNMAIYAASKAAINTFTIAVAREVGVDGVRVNAISPGIIDTDQHSNITKERLLNLVASIPLGRMGEPQEVAAAVIWILSPDSSYVSGATLSINGGR